MVIDLNSSSSQHALSARGKVSTQRSSSAVSVTDTPASTAKPDIVQLSDTAKALKVADARIAATPDVNAERVAQLRASIEEGSYQVNAERIAQKMIDMESLLG